MATPPCQRLVLRPSTLVETLIRRDGANAMAAISQEQGESYAADPEAISLGLTSNSSNERYSALEKLVWCQLNGFGSLFLDYGAIKAVLPLLFSLDMTTASLAATSIACFAAETPAAVSESGGGEVLLQLLRCGPRLNGSLVLTSALRALTTLVMDSGDGLTAEDAAHAAEAAAADRAESSKASSASAPRSTFSNPTQNAPLVNSESFCPTVIESHAPHLEASKGRSNAVEAVLSDADARASSESSAGASTEVNE